MPSFDFSPDGSSVVVTRDDGTRVPSLTSALPPEYRAMAIAQKQERDAAMLAQGASMPEENASQVAMSPAPAPPAVPDVGPQMSVAPPPGPAASFGGGGTGGGGTGGGGGAPGSVPWQPPPPTVSIDSLPSAAPPAGRKVIKDTGPAAPPPPEGPPMAFEQSQAIEQHGRSQTVRQGVPSPDTQRAIEKAAWGEERAALGSLEAERENASKAAEELKEASSKFAFDDFIGRGVSAARERNAYDEKQRAYEDFKGSTVDHDKAWADQATPEKAAALIGIGLLFGPAVAFASLLGLASADVNEQRRQVEHKGAVKSAAAQLYQDALAETKSGEAARAIAMDQKIRDIDIRAKAMALKSGNPVALANYAKLKAAGDAQRAQLRGQYEAALQGTRLTESESARKMSTTVGTAKQNGKAGNGDHVGPVIAVGDDRVKLRDGFPAPTYDKMVESVASTNGAIGNIDALIEQQAGPLANTFDRATAEAIVNIIAPTFNHGLGDGAMTGHDLERWKDSMIRSITSVNSRADARNALKAGMLRVMKGRLRVIAEGKVQPDGSLAPLE